MSIKVLDIIRGDKKVIAQALNLLENRKPEYHSQVKELMAQLTLSARQGRHVIGITGPPGVGKSTLLTHLIREYRSRGKTVGVISVDPSSKKSGGALLGDRARIAYDPNDEGLFIRSMAAGSHMGGLALRTRYCLSVFEVAYDIVILETVGVGQSETEIDNVAETIAFVVQPGSGDALQFMKAGIMEIPHVLVVNKADQKMLAVKARRDLKIAKAYSQSFLEGWELGIVMTSALEGWGHKELVDVFENHYIFMKDRNILQKKRKENHAYWIYMLLKERFGNFGIEALGGENEIFKKIYETNLASPLEYVEVFKRVIIENVPKIVNE